MPDRVTIEKFAELQGLSQFAIRTKISRKVWREGEQWFKGPDGRVYISKAGVDRWVASNYGDHRVGSTGNCGGSG